MTGLRHLLTLFLLLWAVTSQGVSASPANPQGTIWRFHEAGMTFQADETEKFLTKVLETSPITEMAHLGGGVSMSYVVRFPGKIFAVLKRADPDFRESYNSELAAYRMDKLLGLNLVPLTVVRDIDGILVSMQLYYPKGLRGDARINDLESRRPDAQMFDYLIANRDRNFSSRHNVLLGMDGRLIAIDHGRAFTADRIPTSRPLEPNWRISVEVRERLMALTAQDLKNNFKDILPAIEIELMSKRLADIQSTVARTIYEPKRYRIFDPIDKVRPFNSPDELFRADFYDFLAILRTVPKIGGDHISPEILEVFQKTKSRAGQNALIGFILNRWSTYSKPLKLEILQHLWGEPFERIALNRSADVVVEIMRLNAEVPPRKPLAPLCGNVML